MRDRRIVVPLAAAMVVLASGIVAAIGSIASDDADESPETAATASVEAMLDADCERWLSLATTESRRFVTAIGGCPLTEPVAGAVRDATIRERKGDAAIVSVDVVGGPWDDERVEVLVVRDAKGSPWLVDLAAAAACASPEGEVPSPDDCEPMTLDP